MQNHGWVVAVVIGMAIFCFPAQAEWPIVNVRPDGTTRVWLDSERSLDFRFRVAGRNQFDQHFMINRSSCRPISPAACTMRNSFGFRESQLIWRTHPDSKKIGQPAVMRFDSEFSRTVAIRTYLPASEYLKIRETWNAPPLVHDLHCDSESWIPPEHQLELKVSRILTEYEGYNPETESGYITFQDESGPFVGIRKEASSFYSYDPLQALPFFLSGIFEHPDAQWGSCQVFFQALGVREQAYSVQLDLPASRSELEQLYNDFKSIGGLNVEWE